MQHYVLGDVITEISERENNPSNSKYERFVGLEHYVSGEVEIENYGSTANLNSAMKVFNSGDILVARRNVYLKRASVVYFDGLTSGDSIVLRPKNETIGRILPFILNTDDFWDYADQYSDGTMSKRLSPKVLKQYEFDLPDDNLEQLADILWAMVDVKKSYQHLLKQTDELVKSQFIEMFGDQKTNPYGFEEMTLDKACTFFSGTGFPNDYQGNLSGKYPFYKVGDISRNVQEGNVFLVSCDNYISNEIALKLKGTILPERTVVFAKIGEALRLNRRAITATPCLIDNNAMGIKPNEKYLNLEYFFQYMLSLDMGEYSAATAMPSVRKSTLQAVKIIVPPRELQEQFSCMSKQSDKSKFELKQAIEGVDLLIKSMIQQELN